MLLCAVSRGSKKCLRRLTKILFFLLNFENEISGLNWRYRSRSYCLVAAAAGAVAVGAADQAECSGSAAQRGP